MWSEQEMLLSDQQKVAKVYSYFGFIEKNMKYWGYVSFLGLL